MYQTTMTTQATQAISLGLLMAYGVFCLALSVFMIVCMWRIFSKAGEAGWKSIIPIYNTYILVKIATGNGLLFLLLIVPFVNFIFAIIVLHKLSKSFGHGGGFTCGLIFLSIIFVPILAFENNQYMGPQ